MLNVVMRVRTISMSAFFQIYILSRMGLCSGEASLVMDNTEEEQEFIRLHISKYTMVFIVQR